MAAGFAESTRSVAGVRYVERVVTRRLLTEPALFPTTASGAAYEWQFAASHEDTVPPAVLRAAKLGFKLALGMSWEQAEDYFYAKLDQSQFADREARRAQGLAQFLDDKSFRPGLGNYARE